MIPEAGAFALALIASTLILVNVVRMVGVGGSVTLGWFVETVGAAFIAVLMWGRFL